MKTTFSKKEIKPFYDDFSKSIMEQKLDTPFGNTIKESTRKNFSVYQNNFLFSLIDLLATKFEVTSIVLGENNFKFFSRLFILETPSTSTNLDEYGDSFPEFIKSRTEVADLYFLEDLAKIDLLWFHSFDLPDCIHVKKGSLNLWNEIRNKEEIEKITVNKKILETIQIVLDENKGYLFKISES